MHPERALSAPLYRRTSIALLLGLLVFGLTLAWAVAPVRGADFTVNTTLDNAPATVDGDCSTSYGVGEPEVCTLREAIQEANQTTEPDVITLPAGTYQISAARDELNITDSITINGAGAATTIIRGNGDPDPTIEGDRVLRLSEFPTETVLVQINDVTISNGETHTGAGIKVRDGVELILSDSVVSDNYGTPTSSGAGMYVQRGATATLNNSLVTGNTSDSPGGGIYVQTGGTVALNGSSVTDNGATAVGGGIFVDEDATATLTGGAVSGNTSGNNGGGIFNSGTLTLTDVTVSSNSAPGAGGGLFNSATATLTGVTVNGNSASLGGGLYFAGESSTLRNSTVSDNSATAPGGGVFSEDDSLIEFSTITDNTSPGGAGLHVGTGTASVYATIIALNTGDECASDDGSINSLGANLASDATCELDQASDQSSVADASVGLGPLADNGGPTQTHALLAGSPAIDAVPLVSTRECLPTDQRAVTRPQDGDDDEIPACDIGAFEVLGAVVGPTPTPASGSPSPTASALPDTSSYAGTRATQPLAILALLSLTGAALIATRAARRRAQSWP